MARFVSVLSGSTPSLTAHDVRSITNGLTKRSGLIDSRSAVSTDIYADLEAAYRSGGEGTYFPPDTFVITNGVLTGSVYTASAATTQGIRTPANYATRPTASILSTQTTLVGPSTTSDSASVTYDVYLSASNAVRTVLDSITGGGPYGRLGQNPSRTLHSIWHDPNLAYFAWDDFSPGTPTIAITASQAYIPVSGIPTVFLETTDTLPINIALTSEYAADGLGTQTITAARIIRQSTGVVASTLSTQNFTGTQAYNWNIAGTQVGVAGEGVVTYDVEATASFADVNIPSHVGGTAQTKITSVVDVQRVYALTDVRFGLDHAALCADSTNQTMYANNTALRSPDATLLFSDKVGTLGITSGYYAQNGQNINNGLAVFSDGGNGVTNVTLSC